MELFDNRYEQLDLIGRGSFSEVWKVLDTETNVIQALKIYSPEKGITTDGIEMLKHEYALLNDANHPNLLRPSFFMFSGKKDVPPYLILTFCEKGNISKLIGKLDEHEIWILIRDTANALSYLHAKNPPVIHQDIKPENILVSNDGIYQLTDFGVSIQARADIPQDTDKDIQSAGTISYMAPERFAPDSIPIKASDIYSLGVMLFELITGYLPFGNSGGLAQLKENLPVPEIPGDYTSTLKKTISDCLQPEPWKRPTAIKLEEIAKVSLDESLTPKPSANSYKESPVADDGPSTNLSAPQPVPRTLKKTLVFTAILLLLISAGIWGYDSLTEKDSVIPQKPEPVISPVATELMVIEQEEPMVNEQEESEPEIPTQEVVEEKEKPAAQRKPIEKKPSEPVVEEPKSSQIELGYAEWSGKSLNGKPHGYGTMTFRSEHRIDSRDPQKNVAQTGDKVEGNYNNGHLEYGTWIKDNGERIQIFIGQ